MLLVERGEQEARLAVVDRGCGMTPDFVRRELFRPFSSSKASGFGVGAFEARALTAAMGGRLEVDSRAGEGSRFTLVLPVPTAAITKQEPTERAA